MRLLLKILLTLLLTTVLAIALLIMFPEGGNPFLFLAILFLAPLVAWKTAGKITNNPKITSPILTAEYSHTQPHNLKTKKILSSSNRSNATAEYNITVTGIDDIIIDEIDEIDEIDRPNSKKFNEIQVITISPYLQNLNSTHGKDKITSQSGNIYEIDLENQTCECAQFSERKKFPKNTMARFCEHLFIGMNQQKAFSRQHHITFTALKLGLRDITTSAYAIKHDDLPLMYAIIGDNDEWINIYARTKKTGQTIYEASGDFERHGWHIYKKYWSYGAGPPGASLLKPLFSSLTCIEDLSALSVQLDDIASVQDEKKKLSELSDPRQQQNEDAEQFGPENDAWEIPNSLQTETIPLSISLNFRYIDSKNQKSRRTVDLKEIQFYGGEGEFIYGECRMRRAGRTFKVSRMWDVVDISTGEIITDVTQYLKSAYDESSIGRLKAWMEIYERVGRAWLYLLKGNKRPSGLEYDVLKEAFSRILGGQRIDTKDIQNLFEPLDPTTAVGFQRLVSGIKKHHPEMAVMFVKTCEKLVLSRKSPNFADQAALDFVKEKFNVDQ